MVAALLGSALLPLTLAPAAHADTPGPPVFSSPSLSPILGVTSGEEEAPACGDQQVVTELYVGVSEGGYASSAGARCSAVATSGPQISPTRTDIGDIGGNYGFPQTTGCDQGSVVVGVTGIVDVSGGGEESESAPRTYVDALAALCRVLHADGTLDPNVTTSTLIGAGFDGTTPNATSDCPTDAVATGISGSTDYDGDIFSFQLACQVLSFPSIRPEDVNLTWATALPVAATSTTSGAITATGQERWYRFPVTPGSSVSVTLSGLATDDDLVLFKDIGQSFTSLTSTTDLTKLSAEFAGDAFSPSVFSPSVFSPSVFSPSVFSPSVFSPSVFSPSVFSPSVFSPSVFSPSVFSPSVFSPSVFSPSVFSPAVDLSSTVSPSVFSPSVFSPSVFSDAYSSAQTRSVIGISAHDGTADENITSATWNNTGSFYVRVAGRNGVSSTTPYSLSVTTTGGVCSSGLNTYASMPNTATATPSGVSSPTTIILTDTSRLALTAAQKATLTTFASTVGVTGVWVDLASSQRIRALNAQADSPQFISCPYAKNLVAQAARDIVNSYRTPSASGSSTLKYVVLAGDDSVVPFFRYPDNAGLGPESDYVVPVANQTASQGSLSSNYTLGQDAYGSQTDISVKGTSVPLPDLAVGRLVKTPAEITATLQNYLDRRGAAIAPTSSLSTGYDFLTDAADSVAADFKAGTGTTARNDTLITDADVPPSTTTRGGTPSRRTSWTATDLRASLLGSRHDLVFLAGHFSANNTLAADYTTTLGSREVAATPPGIFDNTLVMSAGCHSGYDIVAADGVPQVTDSLDWTEVMAQQKATLVAGTGYQYGDTDFVAYSEKLYAGLAHQLRYGDTAVSVGSALAQAKQEYLRTAVGFTGMDQKALLEATLYGLPMTTVNLPFGRITRPGDGSTVAPQTTTTQPGQTLGLSSADLTLDQSLQGVTQVTKQLSTLDGAGMATGANVTATYLVGPDGVSTKPAEPALPLVSVNVTPTGSGFGSVPPVLRGVAMRSASYTDTSGITPLTGSPATETAGVHAPFVTPDFYPARLASVNYFDALGTAASGAGGTTRLVVTPAQHRSDAAASLTDTQRKYTALGFRLFYSANTASYGASSTYGGNVPALAAPPSLTDIQAVPSTTPGQTTVSFSLHAVGNPAAGLQSVFVTYTSEKAAGATDNPWHGSWQSLDLSQDSDDSTLWTGTLTLPAGQSVADMRYLAQAVNGVGLVGVDDNQGAYFTPGVSAGAATTGSTATRLALGAVSGATTYGASLPVSATLTTSSGSALAGRAVTFALGGSTRTAFTDSTGKATASLPVTVNPGAYTLTAGYDGDATTLSSATSPTAITVAKQPTALTLALGTGTASGTATATLTGQNGLPLRSKNVYFTYTGTGGALVGAVTGTTDLLGHATADLTASPASATAITARFASSASPVPGGGTVALSDASFATAGPTNAQALPATPTAKNDSYSTMRDLPLSVTAPGVLGNDTAQTTAVLDSGPTSGSLSLQPDGSFTFSPDPGFTGTATFTYHARSSSRSSAPATVTITVGSSSPRCTITGTAGNDVLNGTSGNDVICGLGGDDTINGLGGNDIIVGGDGNDTLSGGDGNDIVIGGPGTNKISGGSGNDILVGGFGNDTITGDAGNDLVLGLDGNDTLSGGDGNDLVIGGKGVDTLSGGAGDDILDLRDNAGGDKGDGGAGSDRSYQDSGDTVTGVP